jgi:hypothetical protein
MRLILAALLLTALGAGAQDVAPKASVDPVEMESKALKSQREQLSLEMFKVLKKIRLQREDALRRDKELKAMQAEIRRLQGALEKRLTEKYPALGKLMLQRDDLQEEHDQVREQQLKLREKKQKDLKKKDPSGKV